MTAHAFDMNEPAPKLRLKRPADDFAAGSALYSRLEKRQKGPINGKIALLMAGAALLAIGGVIYLTTPHKAAAPAAEQAPAAAPLVSQESLEAAPAPAPVTPAVQAAPVAAAPVVAEAPKPAARPTPIVRHAAVRSARASTAVNPPAAEEVQPPMLATPAPVAPRITSPTTVTPAPTATAPAPVVAAPAPMAVPPVPAQPAPEAATPAAPTPTAPAADQPMM